MGTTALKLVQFQAVSDEKGALKTLYALDDQGALWYKFVIKSPQEVVTAQWHRVPSPLITTPDAPSDTENA